MSPLEVKVRFLLGLLDRDALSAWINEQLPDDGSIPDPVLELTTLRDKDDLRIVGLLSQLVLAGPAAEARMEFGLLSQMYRGGDIQLGQAVRRLYLLLHEVGLDAFTGDEVDAIYSLDDGYDLAVIGTYGTTEHVEAEFIRFVGRYEDQLSSRS